MRPLGGLIAKARQRAWLAAQALNARVHDLRFFYWEATLRCNLSCRHCLAAADAGAAPMDLPAAKVVGVLADIAAHQGAAKVTVGVTGGEPLLREDLFDVLEEAHSMGFAWGLATNGTLVSDRVVEECLRTGMQSVSVSVDGDETMHGWLPGSNTAHRKALHALRLFHAGSPRAGVSATTCVHQGNVHQLPWIRDALRQVGVHSWRIYSISPIGRAAKRPELWPTRDALARTLSFVREQRAADPSWLVSYAEDGYLGCEWDCAVRDAPGYCGAGIHVGGLLADGSYSACGSLRGPWVQGHVDELPFSEAWESRYRPMRSRGWTRNSEPCLGCVARRDCPGPSLHMWDWKTHRPTLCIFDVLRGGSGHQNG